MTITSDPYNSIAVVGSNVPHWAAFLCSEGEGNTEAEARARLQEVGLSVAGSTVALTCPGLYEGSHRNGNLVVEGPSDAGVVIHGSYTSVEVRDIAGPVRVAARNGGARATRPYMRGLRNRVLALNEAGRYSEALTVCDRLEHECGEDFTAASDRASIGLTA